MVSERGFTLIEVLVVMVVLSFGILGVLQTTLLAARLEQRGHAVSSGSFLAQEALERIGALGWERAIAGLPRAEVPATLGMPGVWPQQRVLRPGTRFLLVYERSADPGEVPRCTVHCFWEDARGGYDSRQVVRLSARRRR